MEPSEPDFSAPPGVTCAEHPDRPAAFTCPRCSKHACIFCWHAFSMRCESCLKRDPASAAPPLAWESGEGSAIGRYFATLASAMNPVHTAPAFAHSEVTPARRFFLLSALPIAALSGVIPFTQTMMFGSGFQVTFQGHPTPQAIVADVAAAMLIALGVFALELAALALPFISLVRSYAPERGTAATRVLLYRSWLLPYATLFAFSALWMLPATGKPNEPPEYLSFIRFIQLTLDALLLVSMRSTARLACGIKPLLSYVIVAVPFVIWMFVELAIGRLLTGSPP